MTNYNSNKYSLITLACIVICLILFNSIKFPQNIISWDVFGYYLYLPLTFIYDNLGLQNIDLIESLRLKYNSSSTLYQVYLSPTGFWVLKYPIGLSYLYFPFFALGHVIALLSNFPTDGFSKPYQYSLLTGGIFYSITGFYFLRKLLLKYFTDTVTASTLIIIYFGTNYLMHSSLHGTNAMSHNYLFTLYILLLWFTIKWYNSFNFIDAIFIGLTCGLIITARQSEIVCMVIPVLFGITNIKELRARAILFCDKKWHVILVFFILAFVALPQIIYWKVITGKFLFYGYSNNPGEGLELLTPFIKEVLFSFRKGWLIYTPIMFFSLIGLIFAVKNKSSFGITILIYFIFNLYIVSSWSNWWYAESFSQRALIPSYSLLALPMSYILSLLFKVRTHWKLVINTIIVLLIFLNIFQTWQFLNGLIHPSRMTKEAYWASFFKIKLPDNYEDLLLINYSTPEAYNINEAEYSISKTFAENFENVRNASARLSYSGKKSFKTDSLHVYSNGVSIPYSEITENDHVKLKVSCMIYPESDNKDNIGTLVITMDHKGYAYGYRGIDLENIEMPNGKWSKIETTYLTPAIRRKSNELKVYFWNRGKHTIYVDDIVIEVWEKN